MYSNVIVVVVTNALALVIVVWVVLVIVVLVAVLAVTSFSIDDYHWMGAVSSDRHADFENGPPVICYDFVSVLARALHLYHPQNCYASLDVHFAACFQINNNIQI